MTTIVLVRHKQRLSLQQRQILEAMSQDWSAPTDIANRAGIDQFLYDQKAVVSRVSRHLLTLGYIERDGTHTTPRWRLTSEGASVLFELRA